MTDEFATLAQDAMFQLLLWMTERPMSFLQT